MCSLFLSSWLLKNWCYFFFLFLVPLYILNPLLQSFYVIFQRTIFLEFITHHCCDPPSVSKNIEPFTWLFRLWGLCNFIICDQVICIMKNNLSLTIFWFLLKMKLGCWISRFFFLHHIKEIKCKKGTYLSLIFHVYIFWNYQVHLNKLFVFKSFLFLLRRKLKNKQQSFISWP